MSTQQLDKEVKNILFTLHSCFVLYKNNSYVIINLSKNSAVEGALEFEYNTNNILTLNTANVIGFIDNSSKSELFIHMLNLEKNIVYRLTLNHAYQEFLFTKSETSFVLFVKKNANTYTVFDTESHTLNHICEYTLNDNISIGEFHINPYLSDNYLLLSSDRSVIYRLDKKVCITYITIE